MKNDNNFELKIWRLHPQSSKIIPAEKTLNNMANESAVKWCGPYTYANKIGFWLFPPVDIDITWRGGKDFDYNLLEEYSDYDYHLVRRLIKKEEKSDPDRWSPPGGRTKFTWGSVEDGVVQIWTGCIFKTPPGWCLQVRSPINFPPRSIYVMEGIIETDWMQYDIWTNLVFTKKDEVVKLRKDSWPPLAQLVPLRRESYAANWNFEEEFVNRDNIESDKVFTYWINYNQKKFCLGGRQNLTSDGTQKKDATTYQKERMRLIGREMEPKSNTLCPFHSSKNRSVVYLIGGGHNYTKMGLNSVSMLRKYNKDIPVKIIWIGDIERETEDKFNNLNVEIIKRTSIDPHFCFNREYICEIDFNDILYLDVDTFINDDVSKLFDKYNADYTACHNAWVWFKDWKSDYLPKDKKPWNGGVILSRNGSHKKIFSQVRDAAKKILNCEVNLGNWGHFKINPWVIEECALSLVVASDIENSDYFEDKDCYNIRNRQDIFGCYQHIIFHSYTQQWDATYKVMNKKRRYFGKLKK